MAKILIAGEAAPPDRPELLLATRKNNKIDNAQCRDQLKHGDFLQARDQLRKYPSAVSRGDSTAHYNCHGLAFACRRTGITDQKFLDLILQDDKYEEVAIEDALPGDVVLYWHDNAIIHTGTVVGDPASNSKRLEIWVVSKWGSGPEVIHKLIECPYGNSTKKFYRMLA